MYGYGEDGLVNDLVGGVAAVLGPYLTASWAKKTNQAKDPVIGSAVFGIAATAGKGWVSAHPIWHELLEGFGYGLLGYTGTAIASSTTTLGNMKPSPVPLNWNNATGYFAGSYAAAAPVIIPRTPQVSYPGYSAYVAESWESPLSSSGY